MSTAPVAAVDLNGLEALLAEARKGPWRERDGINSEKRPFDVVQAPGYGGEYDDVCSMSNDRMRQNARLIVAAVNALPDLIAAARERDGLREALAGDREVQPLSEARLDRILEFEERVGQLAGPKDTATLTWADQRALIAEAVLAYRARQALASRAGGEG